MNILVINCGSSSLKFQLINAETEELLAKGLCERIGIKGSQISMKSGGKKFKQEIEMADHRDALSVTLQTLTDPDYGVLESLESIDAVGHRVVHGGEAFSEATLITPVVKLAITACCDLAPLHNPVNLLGIEACEAMMPEVPQVAVFDTAFHQTMPEESYLYAIPYRYYKQFKIRRYGFHGTSHAYVAHRAAEMLGKPYDHLKTIVCHLGNGASISAVDCGKCVDTSMGLTPLEGLVMGTRSGDVDPGVIEYIAHKEDKSIDEMIKVLNKESGVLGLSDGFSSDFRDLEDAYVGGYSNAATRALRVFALRCAKYIGSYVAEMNGVDCICFTAGVGENSPILRQLICDKYLSYLGITLNDEENLKRGEDVVITTPDSKTSVLVIPTNEELSIARQTYGIVKNL